MVCLKRSAMAAITSVNRVRNIAAKKKLKIGSGRGLTAVLVSHSREEISRLCTEVLELADGRILGAGAEDRFD